MQSAPFYDDVAEAPAGARAYFVQAKDGTKIRFALWQGGPRGLALIFPGRTECAEKYGRMAGRLVERGFSVAIIDWRGQGLSDRLNNSTAVGHVDDFADYQLDLDAVLTHPEVAAVAGPRVMFAHSMGGAIGLRAAIERTDFAATIYSAPMWGLSLPGVNKFLAPVLATVGTALGLGRRPLTGQPKGFYLTRAPFEGNDLTHDQDHWEYMRRQIAKYPALALGTPSFGWLKGALDEMKSLNAAPLPATPTLAFVGQDETIVSPPAIRQLMPKFPHGKLVEIEGARHETWMETPERQKICWAEIDTFLSTVVPA